MNRLAGKLAVISGAGKGMGAAIARRFAAEGATVVLGDILDGPGTELAAQIVAGGGKAEYRRLDVTREDDWRSLVAETMQRHGRIDILVNNAGIVLPPAAIDERAAADWERIMAVNAGGVFLGTKHVIPAMREGGGGSIVNISSVAGIGQSQIADAAYAASKGAVRIFTKCTAAQYAKDRIRCNSVHPGPIDIGMLKDIWADSEKLRQRLTRVPLGRMGTAEEVVGAVLYLASDESSYTTGAELAIDGGALAQ